MKSYKEYLQNESAYQDLKITNSPRRHLNKYYCDPSSQYRNRYRDEFIGSLNQKHVLDLGCGDGFASLEALREGAYVTAIDISPESIKHLMKKAKEENLDSKLTALVMDAHHMSFADNSFDVVFGNGILHHLLNLDRAVSEIQRVLNESGYAVFSEPMGMNPLINLFRKVTPQCRTRDEQPFRMQELSIIKRHSQAACFVYFDCATLIAKVPLLLGWVSLATWLQKTAICVDDWLLRKRRVGNLTKLTFFQKMSWMVLIKFGKY